MRRRLSARKPLSVKTFLIRNEERVLPERRRRTPRPFNVFEAWCYWALPYLGITDLPSCRMVGLLEPRGALANRPRQCVSSSEIPWKDSSFQKFRKKELFSPEVPRQWRFPWIIFVRLTSLNRDGRRRRKPASRRRRLRRELLRRDRRPRQGQECPGRSPRYHGEIASLPQENERTVSRPQEE